MSKKIVVHFGKKVGSSDPFLSFGTKRSVYHALFKKGMEQGFEMYLSPNADHFLSGLSFVNPYLYDTHSGLFKKIDGTILADAVYDRSGGLSFPHKDVDHKVLNSWKFKKLCADKNATYDLLKPFMPQSFRVTNSATLQMLDSSLALDEFVALKPASGFGGKDIVIDKWKNVRETELVPTTSYTVQKFVDTSRGIPGVTDTFHDLRMVIVHGEIVLAHVRTPKTGSLLANVAQGGSIQEVPLEKIPSFVLEKTARIQAIIDPLFDAPLYSIDLGICGKEAYVFELNDQIGFPSEKMNYERFIQNILVSLEKRTAQ